MNLEQIREEFEELLEAGAVSESHWEQFKKDLSSEPEPNPKPEPIAKPEPVAKPVSKPKPKPEPAAKPMYSFSEYEQFEVDL